MARMYSNENFPVPVVEALRALGHDVVTIQDRGRRARRLQIRKCFNYRSLKIERF